MRLSATQRPRALLLTVDYAPQTGGVPLLLSSIVEGSSHLIDWRVVTTAPGATQPNSSCPTVARASSFRNMIPSTLRERRWLAEADDALIVSGHVYLIPDRPHQRIALSSLSRDRRVVTISEHSEALLERLGVEPNRRLWIAPELKPQFPTVDPPKRRPPGAPLRLVTVTRLAEGYKNLEVLLRSATWWTFRAGSTTNSLLCSPRPMSGCSRVATLLLRAVSRVLASSSRSLPRRVYP